MDLGSGVMRGLTGGGDRWSEGMAIDYGLLEGKMVLY